MQSTKNDNVFDIIIAGAGLAGLLALTRFRQIHPSAKILLLEKESRLGGRLRVPEGKENLGSGGLHYVSLELYDFLNRTLAGCFSSEDDFSLPKETPHKLAILQGKKLDEILLSEVCSSQFAKILGGNSAAKQWEKFIETFKNRSEEFNYQSLGKTANITKKDPFLDVLNIMSIPLGIVDPWFATSQSFEQRSHYIERGFFGGPWNDFIEKILNWAEAECMMGKPILDSNYEKGEWDLHLENEHVYSKVLVVAQSPWEAINWLKRDHAPVNLINLALKFSPLSAVSLNLYFEKDLDLPDRILIPSEKTQVFQLSKRHYCIQSLIDYETFLDAPRVVQAVKQVKRSKTKICKQLSLPDPLEDFLSLRPVAWAHDAHYNSRKQVEDYDASKMNSKSLVFCGDAYGASYDPDQNTIKSLLAACSTVVL